MIINDNHTTVVIHSLYSSREIFCAGGKTRETRNWESPLQGKDKSTANAEGEKENPWSLLIPSTPHQLSDLFSSSRACASDCACAGDKDLLWITWARVLFFPSLSLSGRGCTIKTSCGVRIIPCCTRNRIEQIN